jgi:hypothetical protein
MVYENVKKEKVYLVIAEIRRRHRENEKLFRDINLEDWTMLDAIAAILEDDYPNNNDFDLEDIVNVHTYLLDIYSGSLHTEKVYDGLYIRYTAIIDYLLLIKRELFNDNAAPN